MTAATMREAVFTETMQIGIVVRDLEATMRRYVDDFGIGPWETFEFDAGQAEDFHEYGQPVERSGRLAATTVGHVHRGLIEPLDDESGYRRFLAENCDGVRHVAVATPKLDEMVAKADRENSVVLGGRFGGGTVACLGTDRDLGVVLEIFSGTKEDSEWPCSTTRPVPCSPGRTSPTSPRSCLTAGRIRFR
jgi:methylmalonyl-CoA/ethylmalonyl-CoA epimerase